MSYDSWKTRSPDDELFRWLPYEDEPLDIVPCPACHGECRDIRMGPVYEAGCGHAHMGEVDRGICETCRGTGSVEEEHQPRTLDDMEQELLDMIDAKVNR
jgi:hypothetical protein